MRARRPYEVKPRQLRALVLLLALLPLLPMTFVVRFVVEDIADQRLEARERARPVYQKFLDVTTAALTASVVRQLPPVTALDPSDPWRAFFYSPTLADTVLIASPDGRLSSPTPPGESRLLPAATLANAVLDSGVHYAALPSSGATRWRFFCEAPDLLFGLHPQPSAASRAIGPTLLFLKSRQHLLEAIGAFYQRELDPQTALRLIDENGESLTLVGPLVSISGSRGDPMCESAFAPPLPAWRVQLFSVDASLVDGVARSQIALYWWSVLGMIAITAGIAGTAGWALTRRLTLHELSNDALAVVSHEMKTPLSSMRMFIETLRLRRYHGGAEQADEYLDLLADENARLERLVEDFQTLSRADNSRGRRARQRETVFATDVIASARTRLGPRLDALNGAFRVEIAEPPPGPFAADPNEIAAVLVNLLDNALKYSADDPRVVLRAFTREREVVFEISDNGIGIETSEQRRIFERFYQSDSRLSRRHKGCGLGLSIVRSVVRAHGGSVSVESKPGEGSTFTVCLPAGLTLTGTAVPE